MSWLRGRLTRDVSIQPRIDQACEGEESFLGLLRVFARPQRSVHSNQGMVGSVQKERVEYQVSIYQIFARQPPAMRPVPEQNQLAIGSARHQVPIRHKSSCSLKLESGSA
jgi:hypothetical protein